MFNFGIFISLLCAIITFYFNLFLPFKKQVDEIQLDLTQELKYHSSHSGTSSSEIINSTKRILSLIDKRSLIERKITTLNIITFILITIVCLLYFLPSLIILFNNILNKITTIDFSSFFTKIVPFRKHFFSDFEFLFSYITGIILSIILCIIWWIKLDDWLCENYILQGIITILLAYGLVWVNYYVSMLLIHYIKHYFILLSVPINILIYLVLCLIIYFAIWLFDEYL